MRASALVPLTLLLLSLQATGAQAQTLDVVVAKLQDQSLYVHPDVQWALDRRDRRRLEQRIERSQSPPIRIAVLPAAAMEDDADSIQGALVRIAGGMSGQRGIYAVAIPGEGFDAGSNASGGHEYVERAAERAEGAHGGDMAAVLGAFVNDVSTLSPADARQVGASATASEPVEGVGAGAIALLGLGGLLTGAVLLTGRERRRLRERSFEEAKENARDDLDSLAARIRALMPEVEWPGVDSDAADDHARAVRAYQRAERAWKAAAAPDELEPVSMALEEGQWAIASARARAGGEDPPPRRPPCFFDPRHGPSVRDVEWEAPFGGPRCVPACGADAHRVEAGEDPQAREVTVGGRREPYWNAGPAYGPFAGGFFGGAAAGLLPAILAGSVLGMSMGAGAAADDEPAGGDGEPGGDGGFGDFGGGDF